MITSLGGDPDDLSGLAALAILVFAFVILPVGIGWALRIRDAKQAGDPRPPRPLLPRRVALGLWVLACLVEVLLGWLGVAIALFFVGVVLAPPSLIPGAKRG